MLLNFLASLPFAWLSLCINQYNAAYSLIPQSQIATQWGVQGRDITSFLSQLHHWAVCAGKPLLVLKHDQQKGFDFLAPEGFYDGVFAYGLSPHRLPYWILLIKQMSNVEYALHMGTPTYL